MWILSENLVPDVGIELTTFALQVRCSTNWANPAFSWRRDYNNFIYYRLAPFEKIHDFYVIYFRLVVTNLLFASITSQWLK